MFAVCLVVAIIFSKITNDFEIPYAKKTSSVKTTVPRKEPVGYHMPMPSCPPDYRDYIEPKQTPSNKNTKKNNSHDRISIPQNKKPAPQLHTVPPSIKEYRLPDGSRIAIDTDKVEISEKAAF